MRVVDIISSCYYYCCVVHGGWNVWSQWSECTTTCGIGTQDRFRECDNPPPQYGGDYCPGASNATRQCPGLPPCPINCKWNPWSNWTDCSLSCATGTQTRTRAFEPAQHGGDDCIGSDLDTQFCNTQPCPGERLSLSTHYNIIPTDYPCIPITSLHYIIVFVLLFRPMFGS